MAWKRKRIDIGTNTGRDLPCDAAYEEEGTGTVVYLECSLEAVQVLPEKCEYPPCGPGIRQGRYDWPA